MHARIRGFTFLELMVALTIMGMLLMLGMPSFTTFLRNSEIRSTDPASDPAVLTLRSRQKRTGDSSARHCAPGDVQRPRTDHLPVSDRHA